MNNSIFALIKSKILIADVVGEYTSLRKFGTYLKGSCPFHSEKTASFTVSPGKEIFYCFGCQSGGDVITFIEKTENLLPLEAAFFLADRYGIELPEYQNSKEIASRSKKESYYTLCSLVASWCQQQLAQSPQAQAYLAERGIGQGVQTQYMLGYFPSGTIAIRSLQKYIQKNNLLVQELLEAKIISQSAKGLGFYSPFEERIIFPIRDHLGNFCGFGGRIFQAGDERPKYYNSYDHAFFSKSELTYGLDCAKKTAQKENALLVMEGYFDVVTAAQYGYNASIATLGTAFTSEHLKLLNRYAEKLYIMYDGDAAGKNAILKLMQLCWNSPVDIFVVQFPAGDDPASFLLKNGGFSELIKQARDLFTFFAEELTENFFEKTVQERLVLVKKLLEGIATVTDPIKLDLLLQKTALVCALPLERLEQYMNQLAKKAAPRKHPFVQQYQKMTIMPTLTLLEKRLFCAILNKRNSLQKIEKNELSSFLTVPLQDLLRKKDDESETPLTHDEKNLIAKIIIESEMEDLSAEADAVVEHFRKKLWKQKIQTLKMQLARAQDAYDASGVQQLLQEFESLKKKTVT